MLYKGRVQVYQNVSVCSQMRQLEKEGASPSFHKVEFTELPSSTRNCTKIHRIVQQQPNSHTSSKNQNLILTETSMGNSQIWVGKGDTGMTLARRACAMHSELNWRTTVPLHIHRLFF